MFRQFVSYGLAGQQIITATLQHHIYSQSKAAAEVLAETMGEFLDTHGSAHLPMAYFWRNSTPTTLSFLDFISYVAVPHIVNTANMCGSRCYRIGSG
jgi:hypothetical protein